MAHSWREVSSSEESRLRRTSPMEPVQVVAQRQVQVNQTRSTRRTSLAQTVSTVAGTTSTLTIPSGERLTITSVNGGQDRQCIINATVNAATVGHGAYPTGDGSNQNEGGMVATPFQPIYGDTGTISCNGSPGQQATVVGYLTPIPAG